MDSILNKHKYVITLLVSKCPHRDNGQNITIIENFTLSLNHMAVYMKPRVISYNNKNAFQ